MVVDVSPLTEAQKQRLKKIPNNCREDGKEDDDERLCNSWKGALPEDKLELEKLVTDGDLAGKLSSKKVREEHPKFRIYTVACVQNAIGNCRRKVAKAAKERQTMDAAGGGGEGLKAKASSKRGDAKSVAASLKSSKSKSSKQSKPYTKSPPPPTNSFFQSTGTMCKCDATARTQRSMQTTSGLSFCGKSLAADGSVTNNIRQNISMPVLCATVEKAIGGALAFSQIDPWTDNGLNKRGSVDLMVSCGVVVDGDTLQCRASSQNRHVVIVSLVVSELFTNPDKKLRHVLSLIAEAYPETKGDKFACMRALQNHPRYVSAKANLKSLLGSHNQRCLTEHRITAPFPVADALVTAKEDPIFHGWTIQTEESTGETHIHFELKERDKEFTAITVDGVEASVAHASGPRNFKSVFSDAEHMDAVPETVSFFSPSGKQRRRAEEDDDDDDDDSTIATKEQNQRFKRPTVETADEDDDDSSWDSKCGEDDDMSVDDNSEVERLRKEVEELKNIMSGAFQSNSASNDSSRKTSTPKKKKTNEGSAASCAGSRTSRHSSATRGTTAREEKRKHGRDGDEDVSKKDK